MCKGRLARLYQQPNPSPMPFPEFRYLLFSRSARSGILWNKPERFLLSVPALIFNGRKYLGHFNQQLIEQNVILCSTAECERKFSLMNLECHLNGQHCYYKCISALMYLRTHGPPVVLWRPNINFTWHLRSDMNAQTRKAQSTLGIQQIDPLWKLF